MIDPKHYEPLTLKAARNSEGPPFLLFFYFELKDTTYTLPTETLCRKIERQGGMHTFV